MIKAILLVFDPTNTWDEIAQDKRSVPFVLLVSLLPLLIVTNALEGYGMLKWGKWAGQLGGYRHNFTRLEVIVDEVLNLLLSLLVVFVGAKLLKALGETFHGRHTFAQAFRVVAYGLSPLFLLRALDTFPSMHWWVPWGIGIVLSVAVLYHGVPRVMEPDPPHAFGLYLTSGFLLAIASGLARLLGAWWTMGRFGQAQSAVDAFLTQLLTKIHF